MTLLSVASSNSRFPSDVTIYHGQSAAHANRQLIHWRLYAMSLVTRCPEPLTRCSRLMLRSRIIDVAYLAAAAAAAAPAGFLTTFHDVSASGRAF